MQDHGRKASCVIGVYGGFERRISIARGLERTMRSIKSRLSVAEQKERHHKEADQMLCPYSIGPCGSPETGAGGQNTLSAVFTYQELY